MNKKNYQTFENYLLFFFVLESKRPPKNDPTGRMGFFLSGNLLFVHSFHALKERTPHPLTILK